MNYEKNTLNFDWVLINQLAVGSFPKTSVHFQILKKNRISSILNLCDPAEGELSRQFKENFHCENYVLPDHRNKRFPNENEIDSATNLLEDLMIRGSVYVHCFAGVERSPLICISYLMKHKNLEKQDALEYLMQIHSSTNPLKGQLETLSKLRK